MEMTNSDFSIPVMKWESIESRVDKLISGHGSIPRLIGSGSVIELKWNCDCNKYTKCDQNY